jgi:oligopeptide/dipeptide ABC transporter ATP-binding protein
VENIVLEVKDLRTSFFIDKKELPAVAGVSFKIAAGETLGIVGESGSGKSVTAFSIMGLIDSPPGKIMGGSILYKGENLLEKTEKEMRKIRGNKISMIFQEPMTSLNPVYTIGKQLAESLILHQNMTKKEAEKKAIEMLKLVKLPSPEKRIKEYPFQFSGGMRQRVMIAMALSCDPDILIADEPTTALDVTIQSQIMELIRDLNRKTGTAILFITHDLGVIAELVQNVIVMYNGKIVEYASVKDIFKTPYHPYTIGLLNSMPKIAGPREELKFIRGMAPLPGEIVKGCRFKTRCDYVTEECRREEPPLYEVGDSLVRCWRFKK